MLGMQAARGASPAAGRRFPACGRGSGQLGVDGERRGGKGSAGSIEGISDVGKIGVRAGDRVLLLGIALATIYWVLEAFVDALVGEGNVSDRLLPWDINELWMRLVIVSLVVGFAFYVRRTLNKRARVNERLRLLETAIENTNDSVLITGAGIDEPGPEILYVNQALCEETGYAEEELLGQTPRIFQGPGSDRRVLDQVRNALERGEGFIGGVTNYRKDGSDFEMEWRICPVLDSEGELTHWISIQRDKAKSRWAEETMREIREAERRHVARDLHDDVMQDLIDALYSMQVTRQKIKDEGVNAPELDAEVESLRGAIAALRAAINDLRRGDAGEQPFGHLLESVVEATRQKAHNLEVELDVDETFPDCLTGPKALELLRLIQEALVNIRRHSGARRASVNLETVGDRVRVKVADDGRGFDREVGWGGIGLPSMRERAVRLGGDLEILSEPGQGTRVVAEVPTSELLSDARPARGPRLRVGKGGLKGEHRG